MGNIWIDKSTSQQSLHDYKKALIETEQTDTWQKALILRIKGITRLTLVISAVLIATALITMHIPKSEVYESQQEAIKVAQSLGESQVLDEIEREKFLMLAYYLIFLLSGLFIAVVLPNDEEQYFSMIGTNFLREIEYIEEERAEGNWDCGCSIYIPSQRKVNNRIVLVTAVLSIAVTLMAIFESPSAMIVREHSAEGKVTEFYVKDDNSAQITIMTEPNMYYSFYFDDVSSLPITTDVKTKGALHAKLLFRTHYNSSTEALDGHMLEPERRSVDYYLHLYNQ